MPKPVTNWANSLARATLLSAGCAGPPPDYLNESRDALDARMAWWRDARFGMFIHWGPYAVPAGVHDGEPVPGIGEWIMNTARIPVAEYEAYARQFNPVQFDAAEWVRIAKYAGMKYLIITSGLVVRRGHRFDHHAPRCPPDCERSARQVRVRVQDLREPGRAGERLVGSGIDPRLQLERAPA
jgi:hypothetical protein